MKLRRPLLALTACAPLLLVATACVTINVYFPEAAVRSLSQAIEEEVSSGLRGPAGGESPSPTTTPEGTLPVTSPGARGGPGGAPGNGMTEHVWQMASVAAEALLSPSAVWADVAPPEVSSPAIRKIIESRKARVGDVDRYKAKGVLGENNHADLEVRSLDAVGDLKERAAVQRLVNDENGDRDELFREIAAAKKVDPSQVARIRETYAETLREFARPGEWIQMKSGEWKKK